MSRPIPLELPARDPRAELQARLQNAPLEHAEALLAAYALLQGLHDRGVLELLRGAVGSRDKVLEMILDAAKTPESMRGIRNIVILAKALGAIEPELAEGFARSLPEAFALTKEAQSKPPGLWAMFKKLTNKQSCRGLFFFGSVLEAFGRNLPPSQRKGGS